MSFTWCLIKCLRDIWLLLWCLTSEAWNWLHASVKLQIANNFNAVLVQFFWYHIKKKSKLANNMIHTRLTVLSWHFLAITANYQTLERTTLGTKISLETNPICWRCEMSTIIVLSFQFGILHPLQTWTNFLQQLSNKICWNPRLLAMTDASTKASWRASVTEVAA